MGVWEPHCKVLLGTHTSENDRFYCKAKTIAIDSPEVVYVQADGDMLGKVPACLTVKEKALSVIVPKRCLSLTFRNP